MPTNDQYRIESASVESLDSSEQDTDAYSESARTYSTAQTTYTTTKPVLQRHDTCFGRVESYGARTSSDFSPNFKASIESVRTYVSTQPSESGHDDESDLGFNLLDFEDDEYRSDAIPATPRDFADLFPSARRLSIHHDDSTVDGNMNLRVDTLVDTDWSSRKENLTLFHLKMNDLKSRDFSLRRYCRDSGREVGPMPKCDIRNRKLTCLQVCKTIRRYHKPSRKQRPALTKSFSSALNGRRKYQDPEGSHHHHLQRNDSGYGSVFAQAHEDDASFEESRQSFKAKALPSNTIKFEFSNYANVELKRRGAGPSKCYEFEYWAHDYSWKRKIKQDGQFEEVSFHLMRRDKVEPLAHIVPVPLTRHQAEEERSKGGWIPPCSMFIVDDAILSDSPDHAE